MRILNAEKNCCMLFFVSLIQFMKQTEQSRTCPNNGWDFCVCYVFKFNQNINNIERNYTIMYFKYP